MSSKAEAAAAISGSARQVRYSALTAYVDRKKQGRVVEACLTHGVQCTVSCISNLCLIISPDDHLCVPSDPVHLSVSTCTEDYIVYKAMLESAEVESYVGGVLARRGWFEVEILDKFVAETERQGIIYGSQEKPDACP